MSRSNHLRRAVSGLLSLALTGSFCTVGSPAALAAGGAARDAGPTGSIALTVRFDLPQRADEVAGRDLRLALTGSGRDITVSLADGTADGADGLAVSVEAQNIHGVPLTTEEQLGYYQVTVDGLPTGDYGLTLSGRGYTACTTPVELEGYSQHVLMSTGNGSFALGDVDGDGAVTAADRDAMDAQLGKTGGLDTYDLNGDGVVDVTDLSYINKMMGLEGEAQILSTAAIVAAAVEEGAVTFTGGTADDLFTGGSTVTLSPAQDKSELSLPIALETPTEMSEITITTPVSDGAIQAGSALVELEGGGTMTVPFDISAPAGTHATGRTAGESVISINLGKKVTVTKVTITVTKVEGQAGETPAFAAVTQIQFLKDIVSDAIQADTQVKGLSAAGGDGEVKLVWDSVKNVTGYTVFYGQDRKSLSQSLSVNTNKAVVSGLKNNQTYYFQVSAASDGWSGTPSAVISAVPVPDSAPGAPSNLLVEAADTALRLTWGSTKDAAFYQVFYRAAGESDFQRWGSDIASTGTVITDLTNGTEYGVAVKAGNLRGTGPLSAVALGTPKKESFDMPALPADGRIDNSSVTSIVMKDPSNVDKGLCPNFDVTAHLTDSDPNTYWVARDYHPSSDITYTFDGSYDMNYVLVVPYLDAKHKKCIKSFNVTARDAGGEVLYTAEALPASGLIDGSYVALAFPELKGVHSLTIGLNEWEGGGARVSISEVAFYRSNTLSEDIAALFANGSFTALKGSVEQSHITALRERLTALSSFYLDRTRLKDELDLAQALLEHKDNALALVKSDFQSRSASAAGDTAAQQTASALQPLGITARAGATVALYADLPGDQPVYVVPTQFYGESGVWQGSPIELKNGRNYITVPEIGSLKDTRGGVFYLTYAGDRPEDIELQIRSAANVWQMPVLELSGWYGMDEGGRRDVIRTYVQDLEAYVSGLTGTSLTTDIRNATEIATPSVLLSLPADQVLTGLKGVSRDEEAMVETMYQNVLAWEEELFVANQVQGIIDSTADLSTYRYPMTTRQNIRYMRMFAGAFMYAAGAHIGVEYGSTAALVQGKPAAQTAGEPENGLFGWGIAHEIGHNMDKLGKAECTNNLYSLAAQAWDGEAMKLSTRLTADGRWADIFNKVAQGRPGTANNVFVQLGMYWQLHLAYDGAEEPMAFYNQFFRLWKSGAYSGYGYDERFALIAAQVADRDLTEFFTRWGMELSPSVKATLADYPAEDRAIWYLSDASRNHRLEAGAAAHGEADLTASVDGSEVTLTIHHTDRAHILGYEIRRNGAAIGFTTEDVYVDDLGAANNLTYTYSVVPVDQLGNLGSEAEANEVRVAYDKTIDPDLYDLERSGETVTITMKEGAVSVTGIKVTGGDLSGGYTVRVKADAQAEDWTDVKVGALSDGQAAYFQKPGASGDDTRIWTYDAAVLELTGIPEEASVELLDYPGDRVDFYDGAAVGILADDYHYNDGEVIEAGTLVILGTYRGDPRYNYVEVEAVYNTTAEAGSVTAITRPMNGYGLLLAELPDDGAVSDTSDGFLLFVPDLEAEQSLNAQSGVTDDYPLEIRINFYRTDVPGDTSSKRLTSRTLWLPFPDGGEGTAEDPGSLPLIELKSDNSQEDT